MDSEIFKICLFIKGRRFTKPAERGDPVCGVSGARLRFIESSNDKKWLITLYPNPAGNQLQINSNIEFEKLEITIYDLSGRVLVERDVKANGLISNLELDLKNGAYIISVSNQNNERIIKKLVIAK